MNNEFRFRKFFQNKEIGMGISIRRAIITDIPGLNELLHQVHKVHADKRPDLFKEGKKV